MGSATDHVIFAGVFSLFAYTVFRTYLSFSVTAALLSLAFIVLAAVFPDIDHQGSIIHRTVKSFAVLAAAATVAVLAYPVPWAMLVSATCTGIGTALLFSAVKPKHRGATHSVKAAAVFTVATGGVLYFLFQTWVPAVFTFASYMSHLVLDGTLFKIRR